MPSSSAPLLPLYHRIFLMLRDRLFAGEFPAGESLPGELQLAAELGVSRATIRRALALLEAEGLVSRRQGAGTLPRLLGRTPEQHCRNLALLQQGEGMHEQLFAGEVVTLVATVPAGKRLSRLFGDVRDICRIERRRAMHGKPHSCVISWLPPAVAALISADVESGRPLIELLADAGMAFVNVEQSLAATAADEKLAGALQVPLGSSLLRISGRFIDAAGQCFMCKDGYFPADSYQYTMTITVADASR